jgi:hypothetical protein
MMQDQESPPEHDEGSNGPYREEYTYFKPQQYTGKMKPTTSTKRTPVVNTTLNLVMESNEEELA